MRPNQKNKGSSDEKLAENRKSMENHNAGDGKACDDLESGIIVPPGCDNSMLRRSGDPVYTYTPASYRPHSHSENVSGMLPHTMSGRTGVISVPKCTMPSAAKSMTQYLNQFRGAQICLDLWSNSHMRIKKCGILTETGENFLVIRESGTGNLTVIDLKPIRYINIYCK